MLSTKKIILIAVASVVLVAGIVLLTLYLTIWRNSSSGSGYVQPVPAKLVTTTTLAPMPTTTLSPATIVINPNAKTCAEVQKTMDIYALDPNNAGAIPILKNIMAQNNCSIDTTRKVIVPSCSSLQEQINQAIQNEDPYKAYSLQSAMGAIGCGAPRPP